MYHTSNPKNRISIERVGLISSVGWSYEYNHGEKVTPAIFLSTTYEARFDSTYDDDIYEVNVEGIYFITDKMNSSWVLTYQNNIPPSAIKLIYAGTGKSK